MSLLLSCSRLHASLSINLSSWDTPRRTADDILSTNGELTKDGKRYFMTFIDDCTRFCYVYLLKTKDEALHYYKVYKAEVENQAFVVRSRGRIFLK